jgi:hypothetical protein
MRQVCYFLKSVNYTSVLFSRNPHQPADSTKPNSMSTFPLTKMHQYLDFNHHLLYYPTTFKSAQSHQRSKPGTISTLLHSSSQLSFLSTPHDTLAPKHNLHLQPPSLPIISSNLSTTLSTLPFPPSTHSLLYFATKGLNTNLHSLNPKPPQRRQRRERGST